MQSAVKYKYCALLSFAGSSTNGIKNGVVPKRGEWEESKEVIIQQLCGLFGRFTVLDDNAFYPYILRIDNVVEKVKELEKEK